MEFSYFVDPIPPALELVGEQAAHLSSTSGIRAFLNRYDRILDALDRGNEQAACNMLNAMNNHIEAQRGKKIAEEDAIEALEAVEALRVLFECDA